MSDPKNPKPLTTKHRLRGLSLFLVLCSLPAGALAQGGGSSGAGGGRPTVNGVPGVIPPLVPDAAPVTGAGAISGVVIDGATKSPLADAAVSLSVDGRGAATSQARQITDAKGRFVFANLPAGSKYTLSASHFGYLDAGYGRDRMPGGAGGFTVLKAGEWVSDLRVTMWRPGAIGGTVVDERGEPVAGVLVRALARIRLQGRDQLSAGPLTTTDDRGMYRLAGLSPGRYLVQVPSVQASQPANGPPGSRLSASATGLDLDPNARLLLRNFPTPPPAVDGRAFTYPPVFYPGAPTLSGAGTIELGFGEDRSGVDVVLQPVPAARISGIVEGPPETLTGLTLRLVPEGLENLGHGSEAATALPDANGRFTFLNVAAGRYTIDAPRVMSELTTIGPAGPGVSASLGSGSSGFPPPPGTGGWSSSSRGIDAAPAGTSYTSKSFRNSSPFFWGRTPISVTGRDETDVVVTMRPLAAMTGRITVVLDPSRPPPSSQPRSGMRLEPASGQPGLGIPSVDPIPQGQPTSPEFRIQGLQPGSYVLRAFGEWIVKSIMWKGTEYVDRAFDAASEPDLSGVEVTLTNAAPVVTGKVRDAQGAPAEGAMVWFFPVEPAARSNYGFTPQRLKSAAIDHDGSYRITSLSAGEYFAIAVSDVTSLALDEESLKSAERLATRVTLGWGETRTVDLTMGVAR